MTDRPSLVCVTGASGFIGSHVVQELLGRGYSVRAAVRDPADDAKTAHLRALGDVELVRAELLEQGSFDAALAGADYVVHAAASVQLTSKDPQREIVDPAVEGTKNVLRSAVEAGTVRRVVQTSSVAAIIDPTRPLGHTFDESDWNEAATVKDAPYDVSKRESERAAVAFLQGLPAEQRFELTAIHPAFVLGPVGAKVHLRSSPSLVRDLLRRTFPLCPSLAFGVVDVRDVASAHVDALEATEPGPRYVCSNESWWMIDIARVLAKHFPDRPVPTRRMPDPLMYLVSVFDKRLSVSFLRRNLGKRRELDNGRIRRELGVSFRPAEETIVDTARSLIDHGWV